MNEKAETTMNELSAYESLKKQDFEHRKLIKKLQIEIRTLKQDRKSIAKKYAEFCVSCDRKGLKLLELDEYIKEYC